jgi:hypothetical protein
MKLHYEKAFRVERHNSFFALFMPPVRIGMNTACNPINLAEAAPVVG